MNLIKDIILRLKWWMIKKKFKSIGKNFVVKWGVSVREPQYIDIGNNVEIYSNVSLETWNSYGGCATGYTPEMIIGDNVCITKNSYISCMNKVVIGAGCLLGQNTFITDNFHGQNKIEELEIPPVKRKLYSKGGVVLGRNVWTGRNVCIMPGVTIGDNAIIGANSVVTHDVPNNCVVAGIPARIIKEVK